MIFKECTISLVLPFEYSTSCCGLTDMGEKEDLSEYFSEKETHPRWLTPFGERLFTDSEYGIMRCFELKNEKRKIIGLSQRNSYIYRVTRGNFQDCFKIDHIRVWFWKNGKAFITIQISAQNLEENDVLDLKKILTDIRARHKVEYTEKIARDKEITKQFSIKDLVSGSGDERSLFSLIDSVCPKIGESEMFCTFGKSYSITYGAVDSISEDTLPAYLECLRLDSGSKYRGEKKIPEDRYYINRYGLHWGISEKSLIVLGNCKNEFLENGGLRYSVFNGYIMLYQYYLCIYIDCMKAQQEYRISKEKLTRNNKALIQNWMELDNCLDELTVEEHINCIFLKYLCNNVWKLQKLAADIHDEYLPYLIKNSDYNVFISYRREGGFYLARLLYELLEKRGKTPFLDVERLRTGRFDKQLYTAIDRCENVIVILSKGSLQHFSDSKEDWFRNEIEYSIKKEKNIIPVLMEKFEYPDNLPEGMKEFPKHNGISSMPEHFNSVIEKIIDFLK